MASEAAGASELEICWKCVGDKHLQLWIREEGQRIRCSFCSGRRRGVPLPELAGKIDEKIRAYYGPGSEVPTFDAESDNPRYVQEGESADYIIQEIADVEPEIADAIVGLLAQAEWREVQDGAEPYYDSGVNLDFKWTAYAGDLLDSWVQFEQRLKHERRFFDAKGKEYLDDVFGGIPNLQEGIVTIAPGKNLGRIFRARVAESEAEARELLREPATRLGPPPPHKARAGRMNPAGIPVFYGAFSEEVAVAEVRPSVGAPVAVGTFLVTRELRVLDLTFLARAYHQESMFGPRFEEVMDRIAFLAEFHRRMSRPIQPHEETLEYLPTQAIAEYVSNVMHLDGMIYQSVQISDSEGPDGELMPEQRNIVLFRPVVGSQSSSNAEEKAKMLSCEEGSAHIVRILGIRMSYEELQLSEGDEDGRDIELFGPPDMEALGAVVDLDVPKGDTRDEAGGLQDGGESGSGQGG